MEPNSLSFLTYNEINEIQSYMVGGFRAVGVLGVFVFKTTKVKGTTEQGTDAGRSNKTVLPLAHSNRKSAVIFLVSV